MIFGIPFLPLTLSLRAQTLNFMQNMTTTKRTRFAQSRNSNDPNYLFKINHRQYAMDALVDYSVSADADIFINNDENET